MKTILICTSVHHKNTEKIAKAIAEILDAKIIRPDETDIKELSEYDIIGFGSGIYFGKHHKNLFDLIDKLPNMDNKKAFIFTTSGMSNKLNIIQNICHRTMNFQNILKNKLTEKGFKMIREFDCRGFNTVYPFRLIGGISKNRPNKKDIKNAEDFARGLKAI